MFPKKAVQSLVGNKVQIEMKGDNAVLEGVLKSVDDYMNIHLENTVEIVNGERKRVLGSVVLRGNNIIIINPL